MIERMTLARPYAKAVFEIAHQSKTYQQWSDMLTIFTMVSENPLFLSLLRDKTIDWQVIAKIFIEITEQYIDDFARHLVFILASHRKLEILPEIKRIYEEIYSEQEHTIQVQFFSATALKAEEQQIFKAKLEKYLEKKVYIHYEVDTSLVGGFIAKAGNYVIDGSLQRQLTNLKKAIGN